MAAENRLKALLRQRHWQTHRTFVAEFKKAAKQLDDTLVEKYPSKTQFFRWTSGELRGLPYPDACRVLEAMFPEWTVEELFEPGTLQRSPNHAAGNTSLLTLIESSFEAPDASEVIWGGEAARGVPVSVVEGDHRELAISQQARDLEQSLTELQVERQLTDGDVRELANSAGHVVELSETIDIEIERDGYSTVAYYLDFLNLTKRPLARVPREIWFEGSKSGPLKIEPAADSERRTAIQRVHDAMNMAKFAIQISPPLAPGEHARVGYVCTGGYWDENHYWRQEMHRFTRLYRLSVRQKGVRLNSCTASEEHSDGSEESAGESLVWDYDGDDAVMTLTREYLRPNQSATLRWEVAT